MAQSVPGWLESASQERQEIYSSVKSLVESDAYNEAKEQIGRLVDLLGGETECINKGYDEIFYLRGQIKSKLDELCHEDFSIAYQITNPKKIDYIKRAALECRKLHSSPWLFSLASETEWVAAAPDDMEAKIVLLEGCVARQNYESTDHIRQATLQDALKSDPENPDINFHQAVHILDQGQSGDEAVPFMIKAVDAKPENDTWRQQLLNLLQKSKKELKEKSLKYLLLNLDQDPKNIEKLEELAMYYEYFQRWNEAIETRKKIIELEPSSAVSLQKLKIFPLEHILKNANAGTETFATRKKKVQQMILIGPHVAEPAVELATELVKENPEDIRLKVLRADAIWMDYYNVDQTLKDETFEQISKIYESDATYWRTHFTLAVYYQLQYMTDRSLEHYRKANELKPNNYRILKRKISMERGHGDDQQALKDYDDFFRITPEFSELPSYLRFVRDLRLWKRVTEAAELAAKVGLTEDFSSDLEYSKLHQKADEDIEKEQSAAAYVARGDMWINESNPSLAQADFKKALELSPNDPNLRTKLARAYLTEYKWSEAMNELNQAIAADPNNAEAYYRRAQCESANPNATSDAEKACELKPDNVDYWKLLDSSYREAARYTDALRVVKKLQELVPADGVRYLKIEQAEYHQELGQWSEAAALLKEVDMPEEASKSETIADIFKSLPEPTSDNVNQIAEQYQKIVEIMTSLYRMQSAFRMLNQLVQKEPYSQSARLYGLLGKLYLQESNTTAAKENYQKAVQLDPNNPEWIVGELEATRIYDLDSEQLQEHFQKAMKVAQLGGVASGYFWSNIIQYANYEKKYDVALKAHDELLKIENTEVNWTMRGVFCEDSLKNNEEALKSYIKACEISPQDENTWNNRALILNKLGDHTEAFRCAQKAIELNPGYANPYAAVAMVYLSQGKLLEAKEYAEKSIQVDSQVPRGYFVLGMNKMNPVLMSVGQIMEQKQQFHDAQDNYQKFLNIGHPDPDLMQAGQDGLSRCENRIALEQQSASSKYDDHHYHLFLSHYQRTGGLLAMVLKLLLEQSDPTLKIFLDVDDLENIHDLKANVRNSDTVALLITEGVFERRFVIEEITTALELGKTIILIWDKERCPWPDPKTVPDHLQQVLLVRAIIWNAEKDFRNVVVHQIQSKIARTDHPQNPPTQQPQPVQAQAAVSTEQFELIKSSIQQQYDSFAKLIQQALAQQTQMFLQLQSDFNQLQAKVETISSTPATPQGSAPATPAPAPAATSSPAPAPSAPVTVTTPAPAPSEAPKSEQVQPTPEPTPQPAPVQQQQRNVASAEPQPEPAIEPASETPQPKSEPAPVQQEQNVRTSFGSTDDSSAKPRSETTSSPLVKPRTATTSTPATQVKQTYTMEGWLHKLGGWNKTKWESRYFTCDGQIMIYHSSQQIIQTSSPKGSIHLKDIISVEEVAFDVYKVNCCFAVQVPSKKYFFYADDEMAKMKWIAALRKKPT